MAHRSDSVGLFWEDIKKIKPVAKEKVKRLPPEKTWERPDYLPNLAEARALVLDEFTDMELWAAQVNREKLVYDMEIYPNYVLAAFRSIVSKKVVYFELSDLWFGTEACDLAKFLWILQNFCLINFNGRHFDFPISAIMAAGLTTEDMWQATVMIIAQQIQAHKVLQKFHVKKIERIDQIDLIELTALAPSLKKCAGRLHAKRLQELPFKPGTYLTQDQALIVKWYCFNDLDNTELLYHSVEEQLQVRIETGQKYGLDLRSHSDAQMAEAIISSEIKKLTKQKYLRPTIVPPGSTFKYQTPHFVKYRSALLQWLLATVQAAEFVVGEDGAVIEPPSFKDLVLEINNGRYSFGIGGMHTKEKSTAHKSDERYVVIDTDVTSYYPYLILNAGMTPKNLGKDFIIVYDGIVVARVNAKAAGEFIVAECLKIVANGTFGKLGSKWSVMYAPDLFIQVTITGQLSILMLGERFELAGIEVVSCNTDGIVCKVLREREPDFHAIVKQWEQDTGLATEETRYKALYTKDVNNYVAIYEKPDKKGKLFKAKGLYAPTSPKKNAVNEICIQAATEMMLHDKPIMQTLKESKKISNFTTMREVESGAVKVMETNYDFNLADDEKAIIARAKGCILLASGEWIPHSRSDEPTTLDAVYKWACELGKTMYLGKIVRWYYATGAQGEIISAKTGHKVARSDNAKPCMVLPDEFPNDINYSWYEEETLRVLKKIGYLTEAT